jgi:hypothetical protein
MLKRFVKSVQDFTQSHMFNDKHKPMDQSPDNKGPGSAMPESADKKGQGSRNRINQFISFKAKIFFFW